ncbi:hypothetical protein JZ751_004106 [Albula glossodonta]|uniref:Uncharacterized protein n=1 Tax=Albula glossodonta TaxID=121402 RepID=A0A8T2PA40_9TELE|nr:hypothetical protein JZ751_004106 [Albula glossodonta]
MWAFEEPRFRVPTEAPHLGTQLPGPRSLTVPCTSFRRTEYRSSPGHLSGYTTQCNCTPSSACPWHHASITHGRGAQPVVAGVGRGESSPEQLGPLSARLTLT